MTINRILFAKNSFIQILISSTRYTLRTLIAQQKGEEDENVVYVLFRQREKHVAIGDVLILNSKENRLKICTYSNTYHLERPPPPSEGRTTI